MCHDAGAERGAHGELALARLRLARAAGSSTFAHAISSTIADRAHHDPEHVADAADDVVLQGPQRGRDVPGID